jgi:hypothetical protein
MFNLVMSEAIFVIVIIINSSSLTALGGLRLYKYYLRLCRSLVIRMQFPIPPFASSSVTQPNCHIFSSHALCDPRSQETGGV